MLNYIFIGSATIILFVATYRLYKKLKNKCEPFWYRTNVAKSIYYSEQMEAVEGYIFFKKKPGKKGKNRLLKKYKYKENVDFEKEKFFINEYGKLDFEGNNFFKKEATRRNKS